MSAVSHGAAMKFSRARKSAWRVLSAFLLWLSAALPCVAQQKASDPPRLEFDSVSVSQVVRLVYSQVLTTPFVLLPEVLEDQRQVAFRFDASKGDIHAFLGRFLGGLGYEIEVKSGVDYIRGKPKEVVPIDEKEAFIYYPKFRDGSFLMDLLAPIFQGSFTSKKPIHAPVGDKSPTLSVPAGSAAALIDRASDIVVFSGSASEIARLQKLLEQVDTPVGELLVKAVVYEVQTGKADATAFGLAASILGGKLGVKVGASSSLENSASLGPASFQAVFSALANDSRFRVMSSPSVRVRSGSSARFVVGQDVPILGALSYPQGAGQAVQAVEYRSSGVILDLLPRIRGGVVDLDVTQQLSNFVVTATGVNSSPTLIKRELRTSVSSQDGDLIVIGGLAEDRSTQSRSGPRFLPSWMHSSSVDDTRVELLLVMQLSKI